MGYWTLGPMKCFSVEFPPRSIIQFKTLTATSSTSWVKSKTSKQEDPNATFVQFCLHVVELFEVIQCLSATAISFWYFRTVFI
jgi:hypothetical protein